MALVHDKNRNRWLATIYIGGKRIRKYFKTKEEALDFTRSLRFGSAGMSGNDLSYSLAEAFAIFLETDSAQKMERSQKADKRFLEIALYFFNHERHLTSVSEVRLEDLQLLQVWLSREQVTPNGVKEAWSDTTIEFYCRILKKFFRKMQHTDRILKNPAELWKVPRGSAKRRRAMTKTEYMRVFAASADWFRPVLAFMWLTGARGASAAALTWEDVDFKNKTIILKSRKGGLKQMKLIPIPMHPALFDLLKTERDKFKEGKPSRLTDPVFWSYKGLPVRASEISLEGSRLIRKLGLPGVVLYGLRHALAVELTQAGVPLEITRQAMGHSSVQQTSHYAQGIASHEVGKALALIRSDAQNETPHKRKK